MKYLKDYDEFINEMVEFPSLFGIDDKVIFIPSAKQADDMKIVREDSYGTISAVRFTKAKVLYDIIDDYWGKIFKDVDSSFVKPFKSSIKLKEKLNESKQVGNLYYFTTIENFKKILENNSIESIFDKKLNKNYVPFTRDFNGKGQEVRIVIDGDKLSENFKIRPFKGEFDCDEIVLCDDLVGINKYIHRVDIMEESEKGVMLDQNQLGAFFLALLTVDDTTEKFKIEFVNKFEPLHLL